MSQRKTKLLYLTCKPHIARYISARFGSPIWAGASTYIGAYVSLTLSKTVTGEARNARSHAVSEHNTTHLAIEIPRELRSRAGSDIAPDRQLLLNRFFEGLFDEDFAAHIEAATRDSQGRYYGRDEAIQRFLDRWGITAEVDVPFDTLQKKEYRLRRRKKTLAEMSTPAKQHSQAALCFA